MEKQFFNVDELIAFRRDMHQNAEISTKEFRTTDKIVEFLLAKGIPQSDIRRDWETGLTVDIFGKGPIQEEQGKLIAIRADIDALEIWEKNHDLPYRSEKQAAHLCGHDGHTSALLGGICLFLENATKFPGNKGVRFIFQPDEEGIQGAKKLIEKNCLQNVEEVWGLHNIPYDPVDSVYVKKGVMMYGANQIRVKIEGKGGHSSLKSDLIDPFYAANYMIVQVEEFYKALSEEEKQSLIPVFPLIQSDSNVTNVIPNEVTLGGVVRYKDQALYDRFMLRFEELLQEIQEKQKVKVTNKSYRLAPIVDNDESLVEELKGIRETRSEKLPIKASEDFSEYGLLVKSCFFFYAIGEDRGCLHNSDYNFNDECLKNMSQLWYSIIEDRLKQLQK